MTDTPTRTAFAEHDGGRGAALRTRRRDFADPAIRDADQAQLLRRVAVHVINGTTDLSDRELFVDPACFLDQDRWQAEKELFFRRTPQLAAYSAELPGPNSYTTKDIAGIPVVITRDGAGVLHAFMNVCSHRASSVASGCGEARRLACPYHNWVYALDGSLSGMPGREGFAGLDWADLALETLPVDEAYGFVYVSLDPEVPVDVHEFFGAELAGILASERVTEVIPKRLDMRLDWDCDWKLTYDTFCENYHFVFLHKNTFGDPGPVVNNLMVADRWGWHGRETMCPHPLREAIQAGQDFDDQSMGIAYFLYPNAILIVSEIHQEMFRIYPSDRPGTSYLYQTYALYNDTSFADDEEISTMVYEAIRAALADEDAPMAGSIQRKLDLGLVDQLIYGRNELILQHNHEGWDTELAAFSGR
jgi:phenylpropionate dioxygenase-like ring-hydroxylating dioxygenase large terminal subunit